MQTPAAMRKQALSLLFAAPFLSSALSRRTHPSPGPEPADESVIRLIHRMWLALSGAGKRKQDRKKHGHDLPKVRRKKKYHRLFDVGIDLSSFPDRLPGSLRNCHLSDTISAACFATSVPLIPIAIPTSAAFKDGASLTPSPVIATIPSAFFQCLDDP